MATKKVTQLATATSAADLDLVMIVDVADTAMSPEGTNKQITKANLLSGAGVTQIIEGTNVTISPSGGTGAVTINSTGGGAVDSVNTQVGVVVLDTDDINEGAANLYYTDARVDANPDVVANTAKVGITPTQASEISANTLKVGITPTQASDITTNNAKVGITPTQASDIVTNNGKVSNIQSDWNASTGLAEILNKPTIPTVPVDSVNGQTGVVVLDTDDISEGTTNLYYTEARVDANPDVVANTAKVGITPTQSANITANVDGVADNSIDISQNALDISNLVSNVQSDWNASSGLAVILNKPTIPSGGVTQIVAGTNVTISPTGGTGAVTVNASGGGGGGTNNVTQNFSFFDSKVPVRDVFIPLTSESENTSIQRYGRYVCAYSGQVEKITIVTTASMSGGTGGSIEVIKYSGTTPTTIETVSFASMIGYQTTTLTFSSSSAFVAGDVLAFYLTNGFTIAYGNMSGQILFSVS